MLSPIVLLHSDNSFHLLFCHLSTLVAAVKVPPPSENALDHGTLFSRCIHTPFFSGFPVGVLGYYS